MKKSAIIVGILITLVLLLGCSPSSTPTGPLVVLEHDLVGLETGCYKCVKVEAIVKNTDSSTIETAELTVRFYRENKSLISTAQATVMDLKPDETKLVTISCSGVDCLKAKTYELEVQVGPSP